MHRFPRLSAVLGLVLALGTPAAAQCELTRLPTFAPERLRQFGYGMAVDDGQALVLASSGADGLRSYRRTGTTWIETGYLSPAPGLTYSAVDIEGRRALAGASSYNGGEGGAFVLELKDGLWEPVALLEHPDADEWDRMGTSVALDGGTAVLGGPTGTVRGDALAGTVMVFEEQASGWEFVRRLRPDRLNRTDYYGQVLALEGDLLLIGAPGDDTRGFNAGAVYVWRRNADGAWRQDDKLLAPVQAGHYGTALAVQGERLFVSAMRYIVGEGEALRDLGGVVYVYERDPEGEWRRVAQVLSPLDVAVQGFGSSLAIEGSRLVVGARTAPVDGLLRTGRAGLVFLFDERERGTWTHVRTLHATVPGWNDFFGAALALDGDDLLVGATGDDQHGYGAGAAYAFELDPTRCSMRSSRPAVPVRAGGTVGFTLDAGPEHAGRPYWLLGSHAGTSPGLPVAGWQLPLNPDAYFQLTLEPAAGFLTRGVGVLDDVGRASAKLRLPPLPAALGGTVLHHAGLVLDPASGLPCFVSQARPLLLR